MLELEKKNRKKTRNQTACRPFNKCENGIEGAGRGRHTKERDGAEGEEGVPGQTVNEVYVELLARQCLLLPLLVFLLLPRFFYIFCIWILFLWFYVVCGCCCAALYFIPTVQIQIRWICNFVWGHYEQGIAFWSTEHTHTNTKIAQNGKWNWSSVFLKANLENL